MSGYLQLPLAFDVQRMRRELDALGEAAWIGHFNTGDYEGGWRCVPLRSVEGRSDHILPIEGASYADTAWLDHCPYLREVIDSFRCEKTSVRLMALEPGALIREHRDPGTALEQGITRVHVPIATTPETIFRIEGEVVHFSAGQAWYLNASCLHGVENRGATPRVHLMLDCVTNPWLEDLFLAAGGIRREPLSANELSLLRGRSVPYDGQSLCGWFPVTFGMGARAAPAIGWRFLGERPLTAAFFEDSLAGQPSQERQVCHTPLEALDGFTDSVAPSAFVFHVSRCGSTLLTQILATLPSCVVLSEPPVLDAFLRFHHRHPRHSGGAETFRRLVAALAQRRTGRERHCVVKMDSWHTPWIGFLREAFPDTPFVFLYREPREVLASHGRQRGRQMVPGLVDTSLLRPDLAGLQPGDLDAYAARMLDAVFAAGVQAASCTGLRRVNYTELPKTVFSDLMPQWGIACEGEELAAAQARAMFHSKHPGRRFQSDAAPEENLGAAASNEEWAALRSYRELEAQRTRRA
ncbi:MAG: aspartyl/asparaginyl beta-hydroxylase domain-containing protein [Pseudomonadota bacterium]